MKNFNHNEPLIRGHRVHRGKGQIKEEKHLFSVISVVQFFSTVWHFYEIPG
jgi:hypothetical protein